MPDQTTTLARLNKERDYEDTLAANLTDYFVVSLDSITDISEEERRKLKEGLDAISADSRKHSAMFNQLIQMVVEHGEDNY